jgi:hypothetical protein
LRRAAFRSVSSIFDCQPGPCALKWSRTSGLRRSDTSFLVCALLGPRPFRIDAASSGNGFGERRCPGKVRLAPFRIVAHCAHITRARKAVGRKSERIMSLTRSFRETRFGTSTAPRAPECFYTWILRPFGSPLNLMRRSSIPCFAKSPASLSRRSLTLLSR